jgi:molybdopterin-containing oxidoreductase family iron-sulfur binding subunit
MNRKNQQRPERWERIRDAELPGHAENHTAPDELSRRTVLKGMMAASVALAFGVTGCDRKPRRQIISRAHRPEFQPPANSVFYSSTWSGGTYPYGLVVNTVGGRPVKLEGSPEHPVNAGSSSAQIQADLLSLYDPDRLRTPQQGGRAMTWDEADTLVSDALHSARRTALITRSTLGPCERALVAQFLELCPGSRHLVHETAHDAPRRAAWNRFYGAEGEPLPRFDRARVILSLDCDFMGTDGAVLENIRRFTRGRAVNDEHPGRTRMNRFYAVESTLTVSGANADHRLRLLPSAMARLATALRDALAGDRTALAALTDLHHLDPALMDALLQDLEQHRGAVLVVAGGHLPEEAHTSVASINAMLGAAGATLDWNPAPAALPVTPAADVESLFKGGLDVAIFLGVNPVYDWPGGGFDALLSRAAFTVGHGLYPDETVAGCTLSLPSTHTLESWNDAEPRPGLATICQPVIAPLFQGRQEAESLLRWVQALAPADHPLGGDKDWHDYVKRNWLARITVQPHDFLPPELAGEYAWEEVLRAGGIIDDTAVPFPVTGETGPGQTTLIPTDSGFDVVILPHNAVHDGRFANNGWLQELPDPVSKLVWDNAAAISPATARELGVEEGGNLSISAAGKSITVPALIQPGTADGVVALTLGHGRTRGGRVAVEAGGVNSALLLGAAGAEAPRMVPGAVVQPASGSLKLVRTQKEFSQHDRHIVRDASLGQWGKNPRVIQESRHLPDPEFDLYDQVDYSMGHKWALAIDLNSCVGCGSCITACQAENNIPIVGKEQCGNGREMHWLRLDAYHDGDPENPTVQQQPMLCQHCDNAPCENVCPVNATSHSPEGLNDMAYNRCVGTRYCSNNCPYKVRRFNFFRYHQERLRDPVQELVFNPQVTVRGVGVMEKCTFCVQRINAAKHKAKVAGRELAEGEIQTACQQACPARAIAFGDVNREEGAVARARKSNRAYHILEELNVKPNVTYQARIRNRAEDDDGPAKDGHH